MRKVIPPTGYVEWHEWAERLVKYGAKQRQCPVCKLWFFKCEKHKCETEQRNAFQCAARGCDGCSVCKPNESTGGHSGNT